MYVIVKLTLSGGVTEEAAGRPREDGERTAAATTGDAAGSATHDAVTDDAGILIGTTMYSIYE